MKRTLIRYRTRPDTADRNTELVGKIFQELSAKAPEGVRYLSLRLDDDTFVHFVEIDADNGVNPLSKLEAFQIFQRGIRERCVEPPRASAITIVGNYRML
jgi:hypothetical protein